MPAGSRPKSKSAANVALPGKVQPPVSVIPELDTRFPSVSNWTVPDPISNAEPATPSGTPSALVSTWLPSTTEYTFQVSGWALSRSKNIVTSWAMPSESYTVTDVEKSAFWDNVSIVGAVALPSSGVAVRIASKGSVAKSASAESVAFSVT